MIQVYQPSASSQWNWVTLAGPDAADFLHRLTTVNVKNLEVGQGTNGFFLTAQGKVRAFFTLWRYLENDFAFELDPGKDQHWKKDLLATIDQFTFAEKLSVSEVTGLSCAWIFADQEDELSSIGCGELRPGHTAAIDEEIRICNHGALDFGKTWLTAWARPERLAQWLDQKVQPSSAVDFPTLETWRVLNLRPRADFELTDSTIPLELGLQDAIAENKGCYPGQEVIERIISMGAPPRRLARIDGEGKPPLPGDVILNLGDPAQEIGLVTSVVSCEGKFSVLGLVRKIHAKEGLSVRFSGSADSKASIQRIAPYA